MSTTTIEKIFQFILLTAGREDDTYDQRLGAIHLIKYLYLADLAYAEENEGQTYTGIKWIFHNFGPWSGEAYSRLEPALLEIGATRHRFTSKYSDDAIRWTMSDDDLYYQLAKEIPETLTRSIRKYVHQFNGETEDLLHFVYNTVPMLRAKPHEALDFSAVGSDLKKPTVSNISVSKTSDDLSYKQRKKLKETRETFKIHFRDRLQAKMSKPRVKPRPPRYDEIYHEGIKTFESMAGEHIIETKGILEFSDDIWKSKSRFDPDVS